MFTERRILVVEDEVLVRALLDVVLNSSRYLPVFAENAAQACLAIDGAELTPYAALVVDIDLRGPKDGFEVADYARAALPDLPVIYTTGGSRHLIPERGVPGGVLVAKPYQPEELITALDALTAPRSARADDSETSAAEA